jgi:hypothetical protein
MNGLHRLADLDGKSVGIAGPGSQYQIAQIAKAENFDVAHVSHAYVGER